MNKVIISILMVVAFAGCSDFEPRPRYEVNQETRQKSFKECLTLSPKGPVVTGGDNPWNEVIDSCSSAAYYLALECVENCTPFTKKED